MIFRVQENILVERFDDQILVFDLEKNLPYVLNGVAAFILTLTDGKRSHDIIAGRVCEEFDVGFPQALEDTQGLFMDLVQKEIVERVDE